MHHLRSFMIRILNIFRRSRLEADLSEEIDAHREMIKADLMSRGMAPAEAEMAARRAFGNEQRVRELSREEMVNHWIDVLIRDARYAFRSLFRKTPVFTVTVILTIPLGIGCCAAIFSVINAVLLKPLPYRNSQRLVVVAHEMKKRDLRDFPFSSGDFFDLREGAKATFDDFAALTTARIIVPQQDDTPEQIRIASVTTNFFRMLGGRVSVGRDFSELDGQPDPQCAAPPLPQGPAQQPSRSQCLPKIAILSYEYWQRRYGGTTAIIGHATIRSTVGDMQVVGVLAPGFELFFPPDANVEAHPDVWIASRLAYQNSNADRGLVSFRVIGLLKTGVSLQRAQEDCEAVAARLRANYPIHSTSRLYIRLEPIHKHLVEEVRPASLAIMGGAIFLLLIAVANVMNLFLVRASLREREFAIRAALGGGRWRLVRQILTEVVLLAAIAITIGIVLAWLGIRQLLLVAPANLPRLNSIQVDLPVFAFAAATGLGVMIVCGFTAAARILRLDVMNVLHSNSRTAHLSGTSVLRNTVIVMEVALAFVLLVASGLMYRSFVEMQHIDLGFNPKSLLVFQLLGGQSSSALEQRAIFMREVRDGLKAISGVLNVTASTPFPLAGGFVAPIRWGTEEALLTQINSRQRMFSLYFRAISRPCAPR